MQPENSNLEVGRTAEEKEEIDSNAYTERSRTLPVYAGALDAERDAQIDAGPAGLRLPTVGTGLIAWYGQHPLEGALSLHGPGVAPRVQTAQ